MGGLEKEGANFTKLSSTDLPNSGFLHERSTNHHLSVTRV